jgi:hypothetical protein
VADAAEGGAEPEGEAGGCLLYKAGDAWEEHDGLIVNSVLGSGGDGRDYDHRLLVC